VQDFYLAYARGASAMTEAFFPLLKTMTRANLEVMNYASGRARACAEIPARLGRCRTAQDVIAAQSDFWREACAHQAEASRRIAGAFFGALPAAFPSAASQPEAPASAAPRPKEEPPEQEPPEQEKARDYIVFPESKVVRGAAPPRRGPRNKAAANRTRLS